jgi:hypothetical protein
MIQFYDLILWFEKVMGMGGSSQNKEVETRDKVIT